MHKVALLSLFCLINFISLAQKPDAELVLQKTSIQVSGRKLISDYYYEIRINNRNGEEYSKISIPYTKSSKLQNLNAYITDEYGRTIRKLKSDEITDKSAISNFSLYEDDFIKEFILKHNDYPYTIVYSYTQEKNNFLHLANWYPILDNDIPTIDAELKITVPTDYPIRFFGHIAGDPKVQSADNLTVYTWNTSFNSKIRSEVLSPPLHHFLPSVIVVPRDFNFVNKGSFISWPDYGLWVSSLLTNLDDLPASEAEIVSRLVSNTTDTVEKIRILYHYLQDVTHYINVTLGTGGFKPYPASYVCSNRYGDCKALTNYFQCLLRTAGINSFYTLVHSGSPIEKVNIEFPSQQFDHIILYIPLTQKEIWLDCTSKGPFGYLGTFTQNREVFIIHNKNSYFLKTPALAPEDVLEIRKIYVDYSPDIAKIHYSNNYRGQMAESLSMVKDNYNVNTQSQIILNNFSGNGIEIEDFEIIKPDRDSTNIRFSCNGVSHELYRQIGNDILLKNIGFNFPDFSRPCDRKLPVQIDFPIYEIDSITYEIPLGWEIEHLEPAINIDSDFGSYSFVGYSDKNELYVIKKVLIKDGYYELNKYPEFYNFVNSVKESENRTHFILKKK